jgi:hypothetical protein
MGAATVKEKMREYERASPFEMTNKSGGAERSPCAIAHEKRQTEKSHD